MGLRKSCGLIGTIERSDNLLGLRESYLDDISATTKRLTEPSRSVKSVVLLSCLPKQEHDLAYQPRRGDYIKPSSYNRELNETIASDRFVKC
jgi:hypothetical protein